MNLRNLEELRIAGKSRRSERIDVNSKQTRLAFPNLRDLVGRDQSRNPLAKHVFQWEQLSRRDESRDTTWPNGFLKNVGRKACQGGTKRSTWSISEPISSVAKCRRRSWNSQRTDLRLVEGRKVAGSLLSFFCSDQRPERIRFPRTTLSRGRKLAKCVLNMTTGASCSALRLRNFLLMNRSCVPLGHNGDQRRKLAAEPEINKRYLSLKRSRNFLPAFTPRIDRGSMKFWWLLWPGKRGWRIRMFQARISLVPEFYFRTWAKISAKVETREAFRE